MILSDPQVQMFWREWSKACRTMNWTVKAGLTIRQIEVERKAFLTRCGFTSLTLVDKKAGFDKVLAELRVLQGTSLDAAQKAIDPGLGEAVRLRNFIAGELFPCLELYVQDLTAYVTEIIEAKTRYRKTDRPARALTILDLDCKQLKQLQFTLAARLNVLRNKAGDTIHEMKQKALVPCEESCTKCRTARNDKTLNEHINTFNLVPE